MAKQKDDIKVLTERIRSGDRVSLSRAITLSESHLQEHQNKTLQLLNLLYADTGNSIRIGISGIPGAGKSTFIEALGTYLIDELEKNVAVLAIDPSSAQTGGSILGDKTRMEKLSRKSEAFIRPTPTNTALGGVGQHTQKAILLCEAAGYDIILVETVGIGQSEQAVNEMVDVYLLLQIVGAGDEIQAIKRGVLECVDIVVINKADHGREEHAEIEAKKLKKGLSLFSQKHSHWDIPVLTCSALENTGVIHVWKTIEEHQKHLKETAVFEKQRAMQFKLWLAFLEQQSLLHWIDEHPKIFHLRDEIRTSIAAKNASPLEVIQKFNEKLWSLFKTK